MGHPVQGLGTVASAFVRHAYAILETKKWWWSLEKHDEGIDIQRSKECGKVKDYCWNTERQGVYEVWKDRKPTKTKSVRDLLGFVRDELKNKYNIGDSTCMHFNAAINEFLEISRRGGDDNVTCTIC